MNALDLLKEDHDRVDKLFQKVEATEEGEHMDLFEQINSELEVHTHIEETIFYPAMKEDGDEELQKLAQDESRPVRLAALLATRRLKSESVASFLADKDPLLVKEAALAINDQDIANAYPALGKLIEKPLTNLRWSRMAANQRRL